MKRTSKIKLSQTTVDQLKGASLEQLLLLDRAYFTITHAKSCPLNKPVVVPTKVQAINAKRMGRKLRECDCGVYAARARFNYLRKILEEETFKHSVREGRELWRKDVLRQGRGQVVYGHRRDGKTTALLEVAYEMKCLGHSIVIVSPHHRACNQLRWVWEKTFASNVGPKSFLTSAQWQGFGEGLYMGMGVEVRAFCDEWEECGRPKGIWAGVSGWPKEAM